jgi:hypothetical protein
MATYPDSPELPQGTDATDVNPQTWNAFVDNINALADDLVACRVDDQAFPGTDHTAGQSLNIYDALSAIKHMLSALSGNDNWYDAIVGSLKAHTHIVGSGGLIPFGSLGADNVRQIVLHPPFNRVYSYKLRGADPSGANTITLSQDQDVVSNIARNYYDGVSTEASLQDVYVCIRFTLPINFTAWAVTDAIKIEFRTGSATVSNSHVDVYVYKSGSGSLVASSVDNASVNWAEASIDDSSLETWAANDIIEIYIKLESKDSNFARIGKITFNYTA